MQCGERPSAGSVEFSIWCTANFFENSIALLWCVFDGVTATVTRVKCVNTVGVEPGNKVRNCWTTFASGTSGGSGEVHAICDGEKAFGSSNNDGWVGVAAGEVFKVILFIGCQGSERVVMRAWHPVMLLP